MFAFICLITNTLHALCLNLHSRQEISFFLLISYLTLFVVASSLSRLTRTHSGQTFGRQRVRVGAELQSLLSACLSLQVANRPTAAQLLSHPYFAPLYARRTQQLSALQTMTFNGGAQLGGGGGLGGFGGGLEALTNSALWSHRQSIFTGVGASDFTNQPSSGARGSGSGALALAGAASSADSSSASATSEASLSSAVASSMQWVRVARLRSHQLPGSAMAPVAPLAAPPRTPVLVSHSNQQQSKSTTTTDADSAEASNAAADLDANGISSSSSSSSSSSTLAPHASHFSVAADLQSELGGWSWEELYYLWTKAGGDLQGELVRMGAFDALPAIETLPILVHSAISANEDAPPSSLSSTQQPNFSFSSSYAAAGAAGASGAGGMGAVGASPASLSSHQLSASLVPGAIPAPLSAPESAPISENTAKAMAAARTLKPIYTSPVWCFGVRCGRVCVGFALCE